MQIICKHMDKAKAAATYKEQEPSREGASRRGALTLPTQMCTKYTTIGMYITHVVLMLRMATCQQHAYHIGKK